MVHGNTFKKAERLSLNKRIELLFSTGASVSLYPIKNFMAFFYGTNGIPGSGIIHGKQQTV